MSTLRLTAAQWIEKHRRGVATMIDGRRHVAAHVESTGEPAYVEVEVEDPDVRCALVDGRLDAQDLARVLMCYRGQPRPLTPTMQYVRASDHGDVTAYVLDELTGMVYFLD